MHNTLILACKIRSVSAAGVRRLSNAAAPSSSSPPPPCVIAKGWPATTIGASWKPMRCSFSSSIWGERWASGARLTPRAADENSRRQLGSTRASRPCRQKPIHRHVQRSARFFTSALAAPAMRPIAQASRNDERDCGCDQEALGLGIAETASKARSGASNTRSRRPRLEALKERLRSNSRNDTALNELQLPSVAVMSKVSCGHGITSITETATATTNTEAHTVHGKGDRSRTKGEKLKPDAVNRLPSIYELVEMINGLPDHNETHTDPSEALTDTFGRRHSYLRISLAERCNLRCLYCMPADGVPLQPESHLLSDDEIVRLAGWFVDHGVNKIRLTGGEPLLRKGLADLVRRLRDLSPNIEQIGMTTNGLTLSKHLPELVHAGLTHVNVSLDSLDAEKFARLTRRPPSYHPRVLQAISDCSEQLPSQRVKINCVVLPDNVDELADFCKLSLGGGESLCNPVDVRFIEFMPFSDNLWQSGGFVSYQDMRDRIANDGVELYRLEDGPNDTTKWWSLTEDGGGGRIGFITSMSQHFCGTCNRLRLTSDGKLKVCLFGTTEVNLRDLLRHEEYGKDKKLLRKVIAYSVRRKHFSLGGHKDMMALQAHSAENRPMTLIGG